MHLSEQIETENKDARYATVMLPNLTEVKEPHSVKGNRPTFR